MRPLSLKLRGAIGIFKGLGLEEIEIDFTRFHPGLVALTGKNGSGKTTIIENLHPFRQMVSRNGALESHFYLKDSYRIERFEMDGNEYESKILIDGLTGASKAYLYCNGTPLNDGLKKTYDEALVAVLGSSELFFNSVFSGQKSKGFAELKPNERRELFNELLNLGYYSIYLEEAKEQRKSSELRLAAVEGNINSIDVSDESAAYLENDRKDLLEHQVKLVSQISDLENEIEAIQTKIRDTEISITRLSDKLESQSGFTDKIKTLNEKVETLTKEHNSKVNRLKSDISDYETLIQKDENILAKKDSLQFQFEEKKELDSKVQETQTQLDKKRSDKSNLQTELNTCQEKLSKFQIELTTINQNKESELKKVSEGIGKQLCEKEEERKKITNELDSLKADFERIKNAAELISEVPCEESTGISCKLLTNAHEGKAKLPEMTDEQYQLSVKLSALIGEIEILTVEVSNKNRDINDDYLGLKEKNDIMTNKYIGEKEDINQRLKSIGNDISALEEVLNNTKSKLDTYSNLDELKENISKAENTLALTNEKLNNSKSALKEAETSFNQSSTEIQKEITELEGKLDSTISDSIKIEETALSTLKSELYAKKSELASKNSDLEVLKNKLTSIDEQQKLFNSNLEKVKKLQIERAEFQKEISEWNFLCNAFDKTGIPVLKLENSGIEITQIANELLSLFDNKFRIVFDTTTLTKDKKKTKETFEINIVEEDGVCEIGNKSGGQQVWLETALQLAISLVVRKQGRNIQTAFLDEKDGALDYENSMAYFRMLEEAHRMSNVHNTFVITHRTELLDLIPQQIRLENGYIELVN